MEGNCGKERGHFVMSTVQRRKKKEDSQRAWNSQRETKGRGVGQKNFIYRINPEV